MLGKKILKIVPPSIQKFYMEDTGKLVSIVAASEMPREYLIKQKILPEHINIQKMARIAMLIGGAKFSKCPSIHWKFLFVFKTIQG